MTTDVWKAKIKAYEERVEGILNNERAQLNVDPELIQEGRLLSLEDETPEFLEEYTRVIDNDKIPHAEDVKLVEGDSYGMELGIRRGPDADVQHAVVKRRRVDEAGRAVGTANPNPILDTRQYEVEFLDGS
eukprot:scaffold11317_cov111-Cylindrotheca_fusiformis.AAC.1